MKKIIKIDISAIAGMNCNDGINYIESHFNCFSECLKINSITLKEFPGRKIIDHSIEVPLTSRHGDKISPVTFHKIVEYKSRDYYDPWIPVDEGITSWTN